MLVMWPLSWISQIGTSVGVKGKSDIVEVGYVITGIHMSSFSNSSAGQGCQKRYLPSQNFTCPFKIG